ncbi:unnamed protein product [Amoebophrya sp. A120]|nr:unnamed protein product [Amoebophrya sp. A120]|eukprot:GSA120T00001236001.1
MAQPVRSTVAMRAPVKDRAQMFQQGAFNKAAPGVRAGSIGGDVSGKVGLYSQEPEAPEPIMRTGRIPNFFKRIFGMQMSSDDLKNSMRADGTMMTQGTTMSLRSDGTSVYSEYESGSFIGDLMLLFALIMFGLTIVALLLESDPTELVSNMALGADTGPAFSLPEISMPAISMPSISLPSFGGAWNPNFRVSAGDFMYFRYPIFFQLIGMV